MIDYFALALGHGLIAIALLRLVLRDGLDVDPLISTIAAETAEIRKSARSAGRNAARRAQDVGEVDAEGDGGERQGIITQPPRRRPGGGP
ncbi:MAG: hypothetical protein KJ872_07900 [Alphaproteobacteria bacterium]|nr:hypothetical protein [Alphaproteobacteria bacterium]